MATLTVDTTFMPLVSPSSMKVKKPLFIENLGHLASEVVEKGGGQKSKNIETTTDW